MQKTQTSPPNQRIGFQQPYFIFRKMCFVLLILQLSLVEVRGQFPVVKEGQPILLENRKIVRRDIGIVQQIQKDADALWRVAVICKKNQTELVCIRGGSFMIEPLRKFRNGILFCFSPVLAPPSPNQINFLETGNSRSLVRLRRKSNPAEHGTSLYCRSSCESDFPAGNFRKVPILWRFPSFFRQ